MWLILFLTTTSFALDNGLGLTPQMGWNTWNFYACNINATVIKSAADAMVETGLSKLGYEYINIDDCWAVHSHRSPEGKLIPDPQRFPGGIIDVADYVHSKGLKLGIYSDAGTNTCQGQPGSLGHEQTDADSFASWGVDYLKYDNCHNEGIPATTRYPVMRDALNNTGRPIFYSICNWGYDDTQSWAPPVGNSWRTTTDIKDFWLSMRWNFYHNNKNTTAAGPGGWNDPDMLEVGNGGMSTLEYITHFSLWSIAKAPLIIGCDMTTMSNETLTILSNDEAIAVNQDKLGVQATCRIGCSTLNRFLSLSPQAYAAPMENGDLAVVVVNFSDLFEHSLNMSWSDLGISGEYIVRDLWEHKDVGSSSTGYKSLSIPAHGCKFYRLRKASQSQTLSK